ncbi:aromatic amino acid DMT transporter YddG [Rosenbergiella epipactidis]|uniref:aromatic amino acid DMT transporter YddG n=1 Tax=Rosenbergiella epipactidis TaxID=1544694 RepID=UPI001F4DE236|nr:aromatic amino acid DMT transporter YddG [Rosenbergiella epipactidis]
MTSSRATLLGISAILLWSTIVGLMRQVTFYFGPVGGSALVYSAASALLVLTIGFPKVKTFPKGYLYLGTLLFVAYEICLSLSLGFSTSNIQAIQIGLINYLWPSMTLLLAVLLNGQRPRFLMLLGIAISMLGISQVLGQGQGNLWQSMLANLTANPLSFTLAFSGAIIWSLYCVSTKRLANGCNGITLYFILTAIALWSGFLLTTQPSLHVTATGFGALCLLACAMGLGYAAWNMGILHGNITLLATLSYFIPVVSSLFSSIWLSQSLSSVFWIGAVLVCAGSLVCWVGGE